MIIKEGVILAGLDIRMRPALIKGELVWTSLGKDLVITCGLDGEHSARSLHFYGLAIDFRSRYFTDEQKVEAVRLLRELPFPFQIIVHRSHIHVEFDVFLEEERDHASRVEMMRVPK